MVDKQLDRKGARVAECSEGSSCGGVLLLAWAYLLKIDGGKEEQKNERTDGAHKDSGGL